MPKKNMCLCGRKSCDDLLLLFFFLGGGDGGGWSLILSSTIGCESFFVLSCKSFSLQIY